MEKSQNMVHVGLRLPKDIVERYRAWSKHLGTSVSELMRARLQKITVPPTKSPRGKQP